MNDDKISQAPNIVNYKNLRELMHHLVTIVRDNWEVDHGAWLLPPLIFVVLRSNTGELAELPFAIRFQQNDFDTEKKKCIKFAKYTGKHNHCAMYGYVRSMAGLFPKRKKDKELFRNMRIEEAESVERGFIAIQAEDRQGKRMMALFFPKGKRLGEAEIEENPTEENGFVPELFEDIFGPRPKGYIPFNLNRCINKDATL